MKKSGILNGKLSYQIAMLGHKDLFMIGDAGMPIPNGVEVIDLALCKGIPSFEQVLKAIKEDVSVEYYYLAEEIKENNKLLYQVIQETFPKTMYEMMPHEELKKFSVSCKFAIRTGEFSAYPNIILRAGVIF